MKGSIIFIFQLNMCSSASVVILRVNSFLKGRKNADHSIWIWVKKGSFINIFQISEDVLDISGYPWIILDFPGFLENHFPFISWIFTHLAGLPHISVDFFKKVTLVLQSDNFCTKLNSVQLLCKKYYQTLVTRTSATRFAISCTNTWCKIKES